MRGLIAAAFLAATPALAQDPHVGHGAPPAQDAHAAHRAPAAADPHAAHRPAAPVGSERAPPTPTDHAADVVFGPEAMAAARHRLAHEHGAMTFHKFDLERLEAGGDAFAWEATASYGGDLSRWVVRTEGEGGDGDVHGADVELLHAWAIDPYFNLEAGVRQDIEPERRTYAAAGVAGVAPFWTEVRAHLYLSDEGEVSARAKASQTWRLTQRLRLSPEVEVSAARESAAEAGLRLGYAVAPHLSPYVGVTHRRSDDGEGETQGVVGLSAWF